MEDIEYIIDCLFKLCAVVKVADCTDINDNADNEEDLQNGKI